MSADARGPSVRLPRRRVVVTGLGAVTAAGWGVDAFRISARSGRTAIGPLSRFSHQAQRTHLAGQVPTPSAEVHRNGRWGRCSYADRFALFAALEAAKQAGLPESLGALSTGVFFGTSTSALFETECFYEQLASGAARPDRTLLASHHLSAPAEAVARRLRVSGPVETISSACASAGLAIDQALQSVRSGEVEVAIAGGADSLTLTTYSGFNALRAMDDQPCRPFQANRMGMSLGEGGAVLVLEALDHARARGAVPLAEIVGAGASCDAFHMTAPHDAGVFAAAAMTAAITDAGLSADDVDYVNAHGTGTPLNDAAEFAAMRLVFGDRASRIPVEATKSILGHLLGAAGAIEAVSTVLSLQSGTVPPVARGGDPDPRIPIDLVRHEPRTVAPLRYGLSTSLGFGGANAALLFGRWIAP